MQNSKYQRAHVRVMLKEPEFFIPDNGKNKRGGGKTAFFFLFCGRLCLNLTQVCCCLRQAEIKYKFPMQEARLKQFCYVD